MLGAVRSAWRALPGAERVALVVALGWLAAAEALFWGITYDDAWISLRYAEHLVAGQGWVFNSGGERVEGASNPLWVVFLAGCTAAHLPAMTMAKAAGAAAGFCLPLIALALAARLPPGRPHAVGAVLTAVAAPVAFWAVDGLETGVYAGVLGGAVWLATEDLARRRAVPRAAFAVLAAALLRPEGIAFAIPLLWVFWRHGDSSGRRARTRAAGAILLAGFGAFLLWRRLYFGSWVPNTYWAKAANPALWDRGPGWAYLADFLGEWGGPVAPGLAVLAVASPGAGGGGAVLAGGFVAAQAAFVAAVPRDWMFAWRFMVPAWMPLAVLAAAGALVVREVLARAGWSPRRLRGLAAAGALAVAGLAARRAWVLHDQFLPARGGDRSVHEQLGRWLKAVLPPTARVALSDAGAVPYFSGLAAVDLLGLTDPWIARHAPDEIAREVVERRRPEVIVLAEKDRQLAPGVVGLAAVFPVDRLIGAHPGFRAGWVRRGLWAYSNEYDLVVYFRADIQ